MDPSPILPRPKRSTRRRPAPQTRRYRASVLILVVALLTLLALIGTAFLVTSRTDRSASFQHLRNTRGDMAVESVINLVVSELVGELFSVTGGAGATENTFRIAREPSLNSADSFVNR